MTRTSTRVGEAQPSRERLGRQRPQRRPFQLPVVADSLGPVPDPAMIILRIGRREEVVEFSDRVDDRHRNTVGAAEPATLTLHTALLVSAVDAGLAFEGVEAIVGAERHPSVRLQPVPTEQHP